MISEVVAIITFAIRANLDTSANLAEQHRARPEELVVVAFVAVAAAALGIVRVSDIGILDGPAVSAEGRIQALPCKPGIRMGKHAMRLRECPCKVQCRGGRFP